MLLPTGHRFRCDGLNPRNAAKIFPVSWVPRKFFGASVEIMTCRKRTYTWTLMLRESLCPLPKGFISLRQAGNARRHDDNGNEHPLHGTGRLSLF